MECVECLINENLKDSLISKLQTKADLQAETIEMYVTAVESQAEVIVSKDNQIRYYQDEVKKQKRGKIFIGILSGCVGILAGILFF